MFVYELSGSGFESSCSHLNFFCIFSIQSDNNRIKIDRYYLIRSDHPIGSKKVGVCIYYKKHVPLIKLDDACTFDSCVVTETRSSKEKCFLTSIFCSSSQNHDELQNIYLNFDILLDKINDEFPSCSLATGNFNADNSR